MLRARCRAGKLQKFITDNQGPRSRFKYVTTEFIWVVGGWPTDFELFEQFVQYWRESGWEVWLECRMGRRQGWVQMEDECSAEQLRAFVRYLSGVCWCCCCTIPTIPAFDPHSPRPPPTRGHPSNASGGVGHFMPHFSSCSTI